MQPNEIASSITMQLETAWNNADGADFGKPFTKITDFVNVIGNHLKGISNEIIGSSHQAMFDSLYKFSTVKYTVSQAVKIDTNTILVHVNGELDNPSGPFAGKSDARITMVLIPEDGEWRIRAFHNTLVKERI